MTQNEVLDNLVEECRVDHVGLWEVINAAQFDLGAADAVQTRDITLSLVRGLICERGMLVGFPAEDGRHFDPWDVPPEQAIRRIEEEWSVLGREPDIGEIAWFTSEGDPT
jgi:hypothetical protein